MAAVPEEDHKLLELARSPAQHQMAEGDEPENGRKRTQKGECHLQEPPVVWWQGGDQKQSDQERQSDHEKHGLKRNQQSFCQAFEHVPDSSSAGRVSPP